MAILIRFLVRPIARRARSLAVERNRAGGEGDVFSAIEGADVARAEAVEVYEVGALHAGRRE